MGPLPRHPNDNDHPSLGGGPFVAHDADSARIRCRRAPDRPCVPDFVTDPAVPPVPPHAAPDRLKAVATSVLKGDSDRAGMVRQGLKAEVQEFLPGHRDREGRPGAKDTP